MDVTRLKDSLELWRRWMTQSSSHLGYPSKSIGISSGGVNCWDDISEQCDSYTIEVVDAAISSLILSKRKHMADAIKMSLGLVKVWSHPYDYESALRFGHEFIWKKLIQSGVV
jgi:hypothetical protein